MIRQLLAVLDAEILMQLRQPMAVGLLTLLPLLVVPGGLVAGELYMSSLEHAAHERRESEHRRSSGTPKDLTVAIEGDNPAIVAWLSVPEVWIVDRSANPQVVVAIGPERVLTVRFAPDDLGAAQRVGRILRDGSRSSREGVLRAAGVVVSADDTLGIEDVDEAVVEQSGDRVGAVIPPLLHFTILIVALYTALDVVSGEKERKTGESLLCSAVDRRVVVAGKGIVVAASAGLAAAIGVASVVALASVGWLDLPRVLGDGGASALLGPGLLRLGVAIVLLSIQVSAVCLSLAAWVPDYRTGSMLSAPVMLGMLAPGAVALTPIESSPLLMALPIVNVVLACRDGFAGTLTAPMATLALSATVLHATVAVGLAARWLGQESALVGLGDARGRRALGRYDREAFALFAVAMLLWWFFGQLAQATDLVWGTVGAQIVLFALPALGAIAYLGLPLRETLRLRMPRPIDAALALLAGLAAPGLAGLVFWAQDPLIPLGAVDEIVGAVRLDAQPLWVPLLVFAVLPAVCEEILFRGALLGLLDRWSGPVARVCVVAAGFGLAHFLVPRFLPTAALGVLLGFAALRSGSLWVAILVHLTNNAVAITAGRLGDDEPHPLLLAGLSVVAIGAVAAIGRGRGSTRTDR